MITGSPESPRVSVVLLWLLFSLIAFCAKSLRSIRRQKQKFAEKTKYLFMKRMKKNKKLLNLHNRESKTIERFKMNAYPYLQPERRSDIERRKSRVPVGITFEYIDRRQADSSLYTGPEKRSGTDRRGLIWDRRQPKVACVIDR
jgi:hypothetical protein